MRSYELIARAFVGEPGGLSRDDVLDNVTHYWLTNTAISAARLYWESKLAFFDVKGVEIPVGVTVFPDELYPAPLSWAERAYPKLIHYNKVDEGGHFAAWEQPQTFVGGDAGDVPVAAVTSDGRAARRGRVPGPRRRDRAGSTPDRSRRAGLRGRVVVVQFCTFSCINWLRTVPYVKAWAGKYRDAGLVVLGVHSPEFPFEHDLDKIRSALAGMGIDYPIAVDNEFAVWRAFDNAYWPALYFVDARGTLSPPPLRRGGLRALGAGHPAAARRGGERRCRPRPGGVEPDGVSLPADWHTLESPETYVGYARATGFASPGGLVTRPPPGLRGAATARAQPVGAVRRLDGAAADHDPERARRPDRAPLPRTRRQPGAGRADRRSAGPLPGAGRRGAAPPGHGLDVDEQGEGTVTEERLYQLVRQDGRITDRTFEITFLDAGAQAYVFTFG